LQILRHYIPIKTVLFLAVILTGTSVTLAHSEVILRTSFQQSIPKYIQQQDQTSGVCFDIITELNHRLKPQNIRIVYPDKASPFIPWKRMQTYLEEGELDVIIGMAKNQKRLKKYSFSKESLYTVFSVFAVPAEISFKYRSLDDLRNKYVIAVQGTKTAKKLASIPTVNLILTNSPTSALKMLLAHRGDMVFYHDLGLAYIIKANNWQNHIQLKRGMEKYDHFIGYNRKVPVAVRSAIDEQLTAMKEEGVMELILSRYR